MTIKSTTTITLTDLGDELEIEFDPPDTSPHTAGPLLLRAAWGEAIHGGMSRATFVSLLRDCADQIEAMTDGQYTAGPSTRRKGGAMKDSEIHLLELANAALRSLELDGLIESFIADDGEVRWRETAAGKKASEKGVPLPPPGRCELDS
jgi:hypothetical protein